MTVECEKVPELYRKVFQCLAERIDKDNVYDIAEIVEVLAVELKDCNYTFYLRFTEDGEIEFLEEEPEKVDGKIITDSQTFHKLALKETNEVRAYMTGKIKVEKVSALKLRDVLKKLEPLEDCYREVYEEMEE